MEFKLERVVSQVRPMEEAEAGEVREALASLARPRLVGTAGALEVEAQLRGRFERLGYAVHEAPFSFSTWPGRFGVPAGALVFLAGTLAAAALLRSGAGPAAVMTLLLAGSILVAIVMLGRRAVARLRWGRTVSSNWLVHRPGVRPRYLIVAHRDSKSQPVSIHVRATSIVLGTAAWAALLLIAIAAAASPGARLGIYVALAAAVSLTAGGALLFCWVGNESPGALDNASGLAALLGIARRERDADDVAFLVTDGEELLLAGASAVARHLPPVEGVINLDGLDDEGDFHIIERFGLPRRGLAPHLVAGLMSAAAALGLPARRRDVPLGILFDHMAFTAAGLPAVTVSRANTGSLRRVHRPADSLEHLTGSGAAATVALVTGALRLLRGVPAGA